MSETPSKIAKSLFYSPICPSQFGNWIQTALSRPISQTSHWSTFELLPSQDDIVDDFRPFTGQGILCAATRINIMLASSLPTVSESRLCKMRRSSTAVAAGRASVFKTLLEALHRLFRVCKV